MTPQQYAEVAAQILKDRAGKLGDYQELYENLAARLNLSFKNIIIDGFFFFQISLNKR